MRPARTGMAKTRKMGRPASGPAGQKVSAYPQVMIRLPHETKATLEALSGATGTPVWQLIDKAVEAYVQQLSPTEQRLVAAVRDSRARQASDES